MTFSYYNSYMTDFQLLFESAPDCMLVMRPDFTIVAVSDAYLRATMTKRADILGRKYFDVFPDDPDAMNVPVAGPDGAVAYLIHRVENAAERARPAREVERDAQLLQAQKMEAIGRLSGGIAHDFNNLLTAITGYGYFLVNGAGLDQSARADVQEMLNAADRAADLTRQLLAFSRRQVLKPKILDPNAVVRGLEKMLRRLIGEQIEFACVLREDAGSVMADPGQLGQAVMNLVVNARDAMPDGGRLTVETERVELGAEYAAVHPEMKPGPYVRLAVNDTGPGIDPAARARVFEPFFTTKERGKGTGLGLATVYGVVKQSGGSIIVRSEPGRGARFEIYLPRVEEADEPAAVPAFTEPARGSETVLLVEDDELVRRFLLRLLTRYGYAVLEAKTGRDALGVCARRKCGVDLLLTDIVMPGMRGDELARRLAPSQARMRVMFTSGYAESGSADRGLLGPHEAFILKPIDPAALLRKVREVLGRTS